MLKTVVLHNFVENMMNLFRLFDEYLFETDIFCNFIEMSLLSFFEISLCLFFGQNKNLTDPKLLNSSVLAESFYCHFHLLDSICCL